MRARCPQRTRKQEMKKKVKKRRCGHFWRAKKATGRTALPNLFSFFYIFLFVAHCACGSRWEARLVIRPKVLEPASGDRHAGSGIRLLYKSQAADCWPSPVYFKKKRKEKKERRGRGRVVVVKGATALGVLPWRRAAAAAPSARMGITRQCTTAARGPRQPCPGRWPTRRSVRDRRHPRRVCRPEKRRDRRCCRVATSTGEPGSGRRSRRR